MADFILTPIADKIIGALASSAVKEIAMIWGVNDDLDELEKTISTIKAVLLDAEEKQLHNHQIRNWLQRLGGVLCDADELMDELETEALKRQVMPGNKVSKQVCTFFSSSNQLAFRHKIGRKVREIRKKLAAASQDRSFLILEARTLDQESRVFRKRETHSFLPQDEIVGRKEDTEAIIKLLIESQFEENVSVIPIVGMGGLGKTALAQSVFNDDRVKKHFELKAWVSVSEPFDLKLIVQTITKSKNVDQLDQLQENLRKMLEGKRYLLVLDDVWEENREKWLELKNLLIGGGNGSRVVVTARSKKVAIVTSPIEPYPLGVLDEEKSWSLFEKIAFRQERKEENSNLVVIGKKIVSNCGGIPLAIRTIGSTLYCKHSESEWSSFNKEFSKLPQVLDNILPTLRLSYDNLTSHLKHCFAYCRLFPKDYRINVPMLIRLWMAQGFLKLSDHNDDQCLEDVGCGYFADLSERSFFQEIKVDEFGVAESCKMHDLIHELAIEVAGEGCDHIYADSKKALNKNVRHVSFSWCDMDSASQILTSSLEARKIRTVLSLQAGSWRNESKQNLCSKLSTFEKIRTLCLSGGVNLVPYSIHKLKFVRYLDISYSRGIKKLPVSFTNLLNLQTLKLNYCYELEELPRDMKKLVNLRHLEINGCDKLEELPRDMKKLVNLRHLEIYGCDALRHMPVGFGQLTNLSTLTTYVLPKSSGYASRHCGWLKELMALNNIGGELNIVNLRHREDVATDYESANLKEKQHLQSLYLEWEFDGNATEDDIAGYEMLLESLQPHLNLKKLELRRYGGLKISSWILSLTNLVSLTMRDCKNCKHLDPMSQLHSLKELELRKLPSLEYITNSYNDNNSFCSSVALLTSLQRLTLDDLPNLRGWWGEYVVSEEENQHKSLPSFPQLTDLSIKDCPKLSYMPCYPHLENHLFLRNSSLKSFQHTLMFETHSFSPLSKLKSLTLFEINDLEFLPDSFKSLTSLPQLEIIDCARLKDLCPGILHLTSLKTLSIRKCEELVNTMQNEIMWESLNGRLQNLTLGWFPEMESLPEGIQHVTSLQFLDIWGFDSLTIVPEWIGNLTSLKTLRFERCQSLTSLPDGIRSLTSLKRLEIIGWPILLKRCKRHIGEDWPKIAHIPDLHFFPDPNEDNALGNTEDAQKKWKLPKSCFP